MWSRWFLWTGVSSGAVIALLTIAAIWLELFAVIGGKDSAGLTAFTLPGPIVYAACWYAIIFRPRDYSLRRTLVLVASTFAAGCAAVAVIMVGATIVRERHVTEAALLVPGAFVAYGFMTLIGAIILVIPYAIVATPMALLHRWLLLRIFALSGHPPPRPSAGAIASPHMPRSS